ncbi:MAG: Calx-beta domain-containing protein [Thermoanaerobaculia bacterium]
MSRIVLPLLFSLLFAANAVAATYTVNTVGDTDDGTCDVANCTLREAINAANVAGSGTIAFAAGSGPITITLATPLPDVTAPVVIDGTTQPGYAGNPIVQITGIAASNCIVIRASDTTVRGLDIGNCQDAISVIADGVALSNLTFERNFLGTRLTTAPINRRAISLESINGGTISGVNIGNATAAGRNLLSTFGFVADALYLGGVVSNVTVAGNYFGLADDGTPLLTAARFISDVGIYTSAGSSNITIGGSTPGARNVFGSGGGTQINVKIDSRHTNLVIEGNYFGTDPTGTIARRATNFAIWFFGEGQGVIRNNVITAGNTAISRGVTTTGAVTVQGNWINYKADGSGAFASVPASGINDFSSATGYTIGGPNPGDGNVIVNYATGIFVNSPGALVQGNLVGLDPTGANIAGSGTRGIQSSFARTEPGVFIRDNKVAGFTTGIDIGSETLVTIDGNYVGTNATGTVARPNSVGLQLANAAGRAIVTNNLISGNTTHGVSIQTTTMPVTMTGNRIGVSASGTPLPNGGDGIRVTSGTALKSIGTALGAPNTIAYNGANGISVTGGTATSILNNSIYANSGIAIDLGADGVTTNDAGDTDTGANGLQNAPVLTSATTAGAMTTILGTLNSTPNTTFAIELYRNTTADPLGFGEAETLITRFLITTDGSGNAAINTSTAPIAPGAVISATATNTTTNETSELSNDVIASASIVQFNAASVSISESGTSITLTVTRTGGAGTTTTVEYSSANGTATAGSDYTAVSGTLTFGPADTSQTIVVPITSDALDEVDETFTITLANVIGGNLGSPATETITITDDDGAPAIFVSDASVVETNSGTTTMTFNVTLSAASGQPVSVDYTTADGTATSGSDYGARFGTIAFAPGETSRNIAITINGDVIAEADETLQLLLSSAVNASVSDDTGIGTITNDDGNPSIAIGDAMVIEGNSGAANAMVVLTLSNPSSSTVTVEWTTSGNSANTGSDFTASSGTVTFAPGITTQTITIPILGDTIVEGNESFFVELTNPSNASIADDQASVTIVDDDGSPALTISDLAVNESTGTATVTVVLAPASAQTVTVGWTTNAGTATGAGDFTAASGTLTFTPGQTAQTINVVITNDNVSESPEEFAIALSAPVNASVADGDATITIIDDDPTPEISVTDVSVAEGGTASFQVTLSNPSASLVEVNYLSSSGTAGASDYTPVSGTLSFIAGTTSMTVNVLTTADTLQEPDETFFFDLSGASNATITRPRATATITDDDGTPALLIGDATMAEGDSGAVMASFTVTLAGNAAQTVTVEYATANGTASAGTDYAAANGTLVFTPGTTSQLVSVPLVGDTLVEPDETFFVNLTNAINATLSDNQGLGTITNDDVAPVVPDITIGDANVVEGNGGTATLTFNVTLSSATTTTVTVDYASASGNALSGVDFGAVNGTLVFAPGSTLRTISVAVAGDTNVEGNETLFVNLSGATNAAIVDAEATGTILDDDVAAVVPSISIADANVIEGNSGTANLTFTVTLSAATTNSVTVNYATANNTALAGSDYASSSGTLVFAPGVTSQPIIVAVAGDTNVEGNETLFVNLSGATNATILDAQATGTILDDDVAAVVPSISIADANVIEGNSGTANLTFTVTLSAATTNSVTVNYATANNTALAGSDYASSSGTLVFAPGVTSQTIAVAVAGDTNVEGNETLFVNLSGATNATIADAQATGTILDDDTSAVVPAISIDDASVTEGDRGSRSMSFRVTLDAPTTAIVQVSYATEAGSARAGEDFTAANATLTFAPGVTLQMISIGVIGDTNVESNESVTIRLSNPVNASIADATGRGTIVNDDRTSAPVVSIDDIEVHEAQGSAVFTVTLDAPATQETSITYSTADESAIAGADYLAANGTLTFAAGETTHTVAITIVDDAVVESEETFALVLSTGARGTARILDDDGGVAAVLAVGGEGPGNFGSFFRTVIQMHNATELPGTGNLIVRPMGGGAARTFGYALAPHETRDITATLDVSGFITADLVPLTGAIPRTSVRVFNDGGANGRSGFTAAFVPVSKAITAGRHAILIAPEDTTSTRFNLGIRALANGATLTFTLRRANGDIADQTTRTLGANVLEQLAASSLFGATIENNDAIEIAVTQGAAIVYGSSVDNVTQDPSFTIAEPLP